MEGRFCKFCLSIRYGHRGHQVQKAQPGSRPRRVRPHGCRATEQRDELASFHSITSSAATSSVFGTVRPSAFAVFRLRMLSYLVGASTDRSEGLEPLRIRST